MNQVAIKVENLSKRYRIGLKDEIHDTFAGALTSFIRSPVQNLRRLRRLTRFSEDDPGPLSSVSDPLSHPQSSVSGLPSDIIWALKDVSFEVQRGEVLGIIGRNGAGKSTLLKILSRITEPTSGRAEIYGRVSSLLEVGTGFHPELTGRENVYLNGTILGMRKTEIDRKFDEIVAFSGIEKFIDTPVKFYSSGMRVRLAFSVAAHLEPDILLVDEVLSVGDAEFQKKSLGKMQDVSREGRTVLFVSHNLPSIQSLCTRAFLFSMGKLSFNGEVEDTIRNYLDNIKNLVEEESLLTRKDRKGEGNLRFKHIEFIDLHTSTPLDTLISGKPTSIHIVCNCQPESISRDVVVSINFYTMTHNFLFSCRSDSVGRTFNISNNEEILICNIPKWPLNSGKYFYNIIAYEGKKVLDWVDRAGLIEVEAGDYYGTGSLPASNRQGVFIDFDWEHKNI